MVMEDPKDSIIDALKASQLDLRAENRDLQTRVAELEEALHHYVRHSSRVRALAKRRGEALPNPDKLDLLAEWLDIKDKERGYTDDEIQRDLRVWASKARNAVAVTPEEALAMEEIP